MKTGTVRARGLTFHTLEEGDGPLVLCLHGFPDHCASFRHQLPMLAAAGLSRGRARDARLRADRTGTRTAATSRQRSPRTPSR